MWRKISTHVEVRKGEDEKCAVEREEEGEKERRTACERRRARVCANEGGGGKGETGELVGVGCAKDIAECI